jgi:hypothetical protein
MIWTVILKSGDNFVVHGSSFNRSDEIGKCLRSRRLDGSDVAGIVQGNHPVEKFTYGGPPVVTPAELAKARQAAMEVPNYISVGPELGNDPKDW